MSEGHKRSSTTKVRELRDPVLDAGFDCQECGSRWGGYHSYTFCQLRKMAVRMSALDRPSDYRIARAARIFDQRDDDDTKP